MATYTRGPKSGVDVLVGVAVAVAVAVAVGVFVGVAVWVGVKVGVAVDAVTHPFSEKFLFAGDAQTVAADPHGQHQGGGGDISLAFGADDEPLAILLGFLLLKGSSLRAVLRERESRS